VLGSNMPNFVLYWSAGTVEFKSGLSSWVKILLVMFEFCPFVQIFIPNTRGMDNRWPFPVSDIHEAIGDLGNAVGANHA